MHLFLYKEPSMPLQQPYYNPHFTEKKKTTTQA